MTPIKPSDLDEMIAIASVMRLTMSTLASHRGIAMSVYYTLFMGEMLAAAAESETNFRQVIQQINRDAQRMLLLSTATSAQELHEFAKLSSDVVLDGNNRPVHRPS